MVTNVTIKRKWLAIVGVTVSVIAAGLALAPRVADRISQARQAKHEKA